MVWRFTWHVLSQETAQLQRQVERLKERLELSEELRDAIREDGRLRLAEVQHTHNTMIHLRTLMSGQGVELCGGDHSGKRGGV